MWWALVVLVVLIVSIAVPKIGKNLLIVTGILGAIGIAWYVWQQHEDELARKRISLNEVQLVNIMFQPGDRANSYRIEGQVKNNSPRYTLQSVRIKITLRDCVRPGECETVGETIATSLNEVFPGQARQIDETVHFPGLSGPKGTYMWDYSVLETKGK
jgi:hypothetical protein